MSIDFAAYESIMSLVIVGMKVPDLKGTDPKKIPELVDKWRKQQIYERDNKNPADTDYPVGSDSCTVCNKVEPKDSMNNRSDGTQNYHPKDAIVPTKSKNKKQ
jgi:phage gp29-like protein